jgi:L-alanine-DL-glutamate epimerase-like enolase superfamily enzyme
MKITDILPYPLSIPYKWCDLPASSRPVITPTIVKVATDQGITGAGEAFGFIGCAPLTARAVESALKPVLLGQDPMMIPKLWEEMYRRTYYFGRGGIMLAAISGVEMALWDIAGKAKNVPVYQMLGGRARDKLTAYATLSRYPRPEDVGQACRVAVERGYTWVKVHERDVRAVAAARQSVGEAVKLMVDVNCAWDTLEAISMARQFEPFNLYWYEEPVWPGDDYDGLAKVRAAASMPVAVGENEYTARAFSNLARRRVADVLQPSVFKIGGILEQKKVFAVGGAFGLKVAPHCPTLGPAMAATLQVCFSEPGGNLVETKIDHLETDIFTEPMTAKNGFWEAPEKPGLGFELNEDVLKKYLITS